MRSFKFLPWILMWVIPIHILVFACICIHTDTHTLLFLFLLLLLPQLLLLLLFLWLHFDDCRFTFNFFGLLFVDSCLFWLNLQEWSWFVLHLYWLFKFGRLFELVIFLFFFANYFICWYEFWIFDLFIHNFNQLLKSGLLSHINLSQLISHPQILTPICFFPIDILI